jgi:hypothetical protein
VSEGPLRAIEEDAAKPADRRPSFDVVRVEPTGDAVIAGHFSANSAVELRVDGRSVAQTTADSSGDFAFVPPPLEAGAHRLELAAKNEPVTPVVSDAVTVEVPAQGATTPPAHAPISERAVLSPEAPAAIARPAAASATEAALRKPGATTAFKFGREGLIAFRLHAQSSRARELLRLSRAAEERRDQELMALVGSSTPQIRETVFYGGGHTSK